MTDTTIPWQTWALGSAVFAALTAIFAKVGVDDINPDVATFVRTVVILLTLGTMLVASGQFESPASWSTKSITYLVLSGLAATASWICYFRALKIGNASQVAPIDKLSVVFVALFAAAFLGESLSATGWIGVALIAARAKQLGLG